MFTFNRIENGLKMRTFLIVPSITTALNFYTSKQKADVYYAADTSYDVTQ